ncbi:MAG: ATP-binding protein [SAR202 cluster bacterium]|nr:ATP-binding protein [SAR202 cluster bacterium]
MTANHVNQDLLQQDTAMLRSALAEDLKLAPPGPKSQAFLVALCGLPGTGKSHFSRELLKRVPFVVLSSDRLRKALVGVPQYTPGESARLFAACYLLIEEFLKEGRRVLFDATNLTEGHRLPLYDITDRLKVPLALVHVIAPKNVVRRRLMARADGKNHASFSDADWLIYCRLMPLEQPIGRPHFTADTSQDITPVVEEVVWRITAARSDQSRS